jgi:protein-disulfide isomerase
MRFARLAAFAAAVLLPVAGGNAAPANWTTTVQVTQSGSHVLGNPAAPTKLTEYISYTCNHCAAFDREASDPLKLYYVMPGKLSVEVRHLVRDPIDLTAAMLTHCGAPGKFFGNHTTFLRGQAKWIARANGASPAQQARWTTGEPAARLRSIASDFGFYTIMQGRGYDRPAVDRCLGDTAMAKRLAEQTADAARLGINGTPGFLLNGEVLAGTHDWATLQTQIKARVTPPAP